jgi:hypothetical protein
LGGGITNFGTLTLNDSSSVSRNSAVDGGLGGGIYNFATYTITLSGSSSVTKNEASVGGGIYNDGGTVFVCAGSVVRLSPNDPDDPPSTVPLSC